MAAAIKTEALGKRYALRHERGARYGGTLRESLGRGLRGLLSKKQAPEEFWALRGIDLEVAQGQRVGVIGRNGSGKSTLLKLLARIVEPSSGAIRLRGRVASLLEVGTGFHPELTGRENIFLNGSILGMGRAEVRAKFDAIVDFSGAERFLDTPVKRYSSGMYMRLAFAVAAHLDPDILLVDEVLAVGDAAFQRKCLEKMEDVNASGRTVIFVSHQLDAVRRLCDRCVVLGSGTLLNDTRDVEAAIHGYLHGSESGLDAEWSGSAPGHPAFAPRRLALRLDQGPPLRGPVPVNAAVRVEIEADVAEPDPALTAGIALFDGDGDLLFESFFNDGPEAEWPVIRSGRVALSCVLPPALLNEGVYRVELIAGLHPREAILRCGESPVALRLELSGGLVSSPFRNGRRQGILAPALAWSGGPPPSSPRPSSAA